MCERKKKGHLLFKAAFSVYKTGSKYSNLVIEEIKKKYLFISIISEQFIEYFGIFFNKAKTVKDFL